MLPSPETPTYSSSLSRLEEIVRQIDAQTVDIDRLAELIKEANSLIAFCNDKLTKAEAEVGRLLAEGADKPVDND